MAHNNDHYKHACAGTTEWADDDFDVLAIVVLIHTTFMYLGGVCYI
jgi:hypothetical protein